MAGSIRSCVACRTRRSPSELIRLCVGPDGVVYPDYRARLPGRGAWVDPDRACVERLERQGKILQRAFKGPVKTAGLLERVQAANHKAVEDALSLAARSGLLQGGKERVRASLSQERAIALLLAADTSPRLKEDLRSRTREILTVELPHDKVSLGAHIGRGPRAALVVGRGRVGQNLLQELRRLQALR